MNRASSWLSASVRALLPVMILAAGVIGFAAMASLREEPQPVERPQLLPRVSVAPVGYFAGTLDLEADGVVRPHREINLSAEVSGRITRKAPECKAGRFVTRGTLLLEIDPRTYQLEVDRLKQEVEQAESSLEELLVETENSTRLIALAEQEIELRQREVARATDLRQQNVGTAADLDEATRQQLTAQNTLTTLSNQRRTQETMRRRLQSAVASAKVRLEQAELNLSKAQVRAPIDGTIVSESVEQESFVQAGTALVVIEDSSAVEVRASLQLEQLDWILRQPASVYPKTDDDEVDEGFQLPRTPVTVAFRFGGREARWNGVLWRYEGIGLEEQTRTAPVRILVDEPRQPAPGHEQAGGRARPITLVRGMFVQLTLHVEPQEPLLQIPLAAVQPGDVVWCVRDGKLYQVQLHNAVAVEGGVAVPISENELRPDDEVVTSPLAVASDGMPVQVAAPAKDQEAVPAELR